MPEIYAYIGLISVLVAIVIGFATWEFFIKKREKVKKDRFKIKY